MTAQARTLETLYLYSEECWQLLQQAVQQQEALAATTPNRDTQLSQVYKSRYADSSSSEDEESSKQVTNEEEEEEESSGSSSSSSSGEDEEGTDEGNATNDDDDKPEAAGDVSDPQVKPKKKKKRTKTEMNQRQKEFQIQKHFQTLSCVSLPLPANESDEAAAETQPKVLELPLSLLSKEDARSDALQQARSFRDLAAPFHETADSTSASRQNKYVVVLFLRTGRFAGAVFDTTVPKTSNNCVTHRTLQRYTVRRGQGKAQSASDGQKKAKSMGAQLRRAGEVALQQDLTATLIEWKDYIQKASFILISTPKTMRKNLFEGAEHVWTKDDARIRRVPLDLGRPTFENVCLIHDTMTRVVVKEAPLSTDEGEANEIGVLVEQETAVAQKDTKAEERPAKPTFRQLSEIHIAAQEGDTEKLRTILSTLKDIAATADTTERQDLVNETAGPDWMTALHYASESTASSKSVEGATAAECVQLLLETGHANPCIVDARNRPAYFLASHEKVRDAFRISRANLGEDYCSWDGGAKVGPPLTVDAIQVRKEKEAEKRRKKKARQKEKKAKEKAQAAEAERARQEEEERQQKEQEAKRIRDGLRPKAAATGGGKACDFCQTVCKGRKRSQMFKRLEYTYCSSECVQKHKRELMAKAALARFGG